MLPKLQRHKERFARWEKMRFLGGLKTMEDYALGVELMIALGKEAEQQKLREPFGQRGR